MNEKVMLVRKNPFPKECDKTIRARSSFGAFIYALFSVDLVTLG